MQFNLVTFINNNEYIISYVLPIGIRFNAKRHLKFFGLLNQGSVQLLLNLEKYY